MTTDLDGLSRELISLMRLFLQKDQQAAKDGVDN